MAAEITSQNTSWIDPSLVGTWKMGWVIMLESLDDVLSWMNDVDAKTQIGSNAVRQGGKLHTIHLMLLFAEKIYLIKWGIMWRIELCSLGPKKW